VIFLDSVAKREKMKEMMRKQQEEAELAAFGR